MKKMKVDWLRLEWLVIKFMLVGLFIFFYVPMFAIPFIEKDYVIIFDLNSHGEFIYEFVFMTTILIMIIHYHLCLFFKKNKSI